MKFRRRWDVSPRRLFLGKRPLEEAAQAGSGQAWMFLGDIYDRGVG